jgi:micrococcal nuclease
VQGQAVTVAASGHDDYGRTLARLRVRGRDVGGWMVAHGHAWSYRYRRNAGPYARQQRQAQAAQLGLFVDPGAQEPRDFRQQHGTCH